MAFRWNATKIQSFNHFGREVWVVTGTWRGNEHILILLTSRICMWTMCHSSGILTYATSLCVKKVLRSFVVSARLSNFTPLSSIFRSSHPTTTLQILLLHLAGCRTLHLHRCGLHSKKLLSRCFSKKCDWPTLDFLLTN